MTKEYRAWGSMLDRCFKKSCKAYPEYGGRGITVCDRWLTFENFLADMGEPPTPKHSLDRFPDNDGNYEPGNCRWATATQQQNNTRWNRNITLNGKTQSVSAWARELGIKRATINNRKRRGKTDAECLAPISQEYAKRHICRPKDALC